MTELQGTESYTVYLSVLFLSKLSHNPDFFQIAPILLDEACMKYRSSSSSGFQCLKISKNIFHYYMAESVLAMRLVNLRSVTCFTDQNF